MDEPGLESNLKPKTRTCGFRISVVDVVVLVGSTIATVGLYFVLGEYSLFIPFVVYHFFLFCNVFRIRRIPELIWAGIFLTSCTVCIICQQFNIALIFSIQFVFTVAIILYEIRQPTYHGIFSRKLNPRLYEYLSGNL